MNLATCTYQEFGPDMGTPVRTTVGAPSRLKLDYKLAGHAQLITPTRPMLGLSKAAYELAYLRLLSSSGAERILAELTAIHTAAGGTAAPLVLLCFDQLNKSGSWCHRTMFATWWLQTTGQEVPELGAKPDAGLDLTLF
ncbi:hypothetical protein [Sphaerisporangium sp. NPDC051011]|uniref:hypothetical protein n=1 Tax=Sphaerisporangium sp. NPDC051011 TaxID=3155792 RepID=UPI0033D137C6